MAVTNDALIASLNRQVAHYDGIRVRRGGVLGEMLEGRPPGTPYVLVEVETLLDAEDAASRFESIAGRSDLAWEQGWRSPPAEDEAQGWLLALEMFVDVDVLLPASDEAIARLNDRVSHRRGIRVRSGGVLDEALDGRPAGTPYVVLEVRTLRDADIAQGHFWEIGGRSTRAWDHGWTTLPAASRTAGWILSLELFVDDDRLDVLDENDTP